RRRIRRLRHRRRVLRPLHRARRAFRRRARARVDDGRRLLSVRRERPHAARREHAQDLSPRRQGEGAGDPRQHGDAAGRSRARRDPRARARRRARTAAQQGGAEARHAPQAAPRTPRAAADQRPRASVTSVVVGTAGHIDHGKSALVRALTGTDPDRLKEEQARGITIDLGFAHAAVDGVDVAFVDVPGHERFVKNMLAGVGGIDLVVLVVAADESVMPQTREHFDICRLLQIPAGLVALTKADLVDADTLELARLEVRDLTAGSFLEGAPIVAVSSKTGAALVEASATVAERGGGSVARLPIDRVFSMKGFGTVVTGTLVSGAVSVDDELALLPADAVTGERRTVKVRGVQVHGRKQTRVGAGHRTAVNVSGVDVPDVSRGQSLVTPGTFEPTRLADALVEVLPGAKPLKHGQRVRFHQGTAEILGRASVIGPTGSAIEPAGRGYVRLRLE